YSYADWINAISYSQAPPPGIQTYILYTDLTFTALNPCFDTSGQKLILRPGDFLNYNYRKVTVGPGCGADTGLVIANGDPSGNICTIQNFDIIVLPGVNFGPAALMTAPPAGQDPIFIRFQTGLITANSSPSNSGYFVIEGGASHITFQNIAVRLTVQQNQYCPIWYKTLIGPCEVTNCLEFLEDGVNPVYQYTTSFGDVLANGHLIINNFYQVVSNQTIDAVSNYIGLTGYVDSASTVDITNLYFTFGNPQIVSTNGFPLGRLDGNSGTYTASNIYTNYTIDPSSIVFINTSSIGTNNLSNINTSYLFPAPIVFPDISGLPGFDPTTAPNRLLVFLNLPFQSSVYTAFNVFPSYTPLPCLVSGMKILTIHGYCPVEELHSGEIIITPDKRKIAIVDILKSTIIGSEKNIPCRIPAHYFEKNSPLEDIILSRHHAVFYGKWRVPIWLDNLSYEKDLIGKTFTYYHIQLPDYGKDKLICHNLPIDSFDKTKSIFYQ
ncbi:hypothetical protein EBU95_20545, partial [bacterium]|nr:hypothetical protein [bacterium]